MSETTTPTTEPQQLVVVGGGMVARRLVDALRARDDAGRWAVTLLCEEPRAPYDRVALTSYFTGRHPEDLALGGQELWDELNDQFGIVSFPAGQTAWLQERAWTSPIWYRP